MDPSDFQYAEEMECAATFLLEREHLEGAVEGIAKQIVGKGWRSLTTTQQTTFEQYALPKAKIDCKRCGAEIPLTELEIGDSLCSWCDHQESKGN